MSRRFVFDTVFGDMWTTSETEKAALRSEEEILGKPETRVKVRPYFGGSPGSLPPI